MKKFIALIVLPTLLCVVTAYSFFNKVNANFTVEKNIISTDLSLQQLQQDIQSEHSNFQSVNDGDRQSFLPNAYMFDTNSGNKMGEQIAADYIVNRLMQMGFGLDIENGSPHIIVDHFSSEFTLSAGSIFSKPKTETRWSQNVILRFDNGFNDRVVIGASIDNDFNLDGKAGDGAMQSGTSVAVLFALANNLALDFLQLPYNLDIVFFGASQYNGTPYFLGAEQYLIKHSAKIPLMINLSKLGGEKTYVYAGETKNDLKKYLLKFESINNLPGSIPLVSSHLNAGPSNLSYSHCGLNGNHNRFIEKGIVSANYFYADFNGININQDDSKIKSDTLQQMLQAYPNAYKNLADTAQILSTLLFDANLLINAENAKIQYFGNSIFMHKWVAYLTMFAVILVSFVLLISVCKRIYSKYPPIPAAIPKKAAVFGEEYENHNQNKKN